MVHSNQTYFLSGPDVLITILTKIAAEGGVQQAEAESIPTLDPNLTPFTPLELSENPVSQDQCEWYM
jgi:hypothetical protein